jgi:hypothetical protein
MSKSRAFAGALAMGFLIAGDSTGLPQTAPQLQPQPPAPYALTMGDMMNTLIQPRHTKLGLAGHAQNWALAGYALAEIRQSFTRITTAQPRFRGLPVGELVDAALSQPLDAVDAAIKQQDPKKFAAAYDQLTQGCNACHVAVDHPYVVIKAPDASAFPNQEFGPRR